MTTTTPRQITDLEARIDRQRVLAAEAREILAAATARLIDVQGRVALGEIGASARWQAERDLAQAARSLDGTKSAISLLQDRLDSLRAKEGNN